MVTECIIVAGGLGSRLRAEVPNVPKSLAAVGSYPFLHYLLNFIYRQGIKQVVLALGYQFQQIIDWCGQNKFPLTISFSLEEKPLGTGGAILRALSYIKGSSCFIINGDTFFKVRLEELYTFHQNKKGHITMAIKPMKEADRYATMQIDPNTDRVLSFQEKQIKGYGLINGGICIVNKCFLEQAEFPEVCSFEEDIIPVQVKSQQVFGFVQDRYFIDIGVPLAYKRAQQECLFWNLTLDTSWTLFLDRDGVLNEEPPSYVLSWDNFQFREDVLQAMPKLATLFGRIIVVTNQACIGKGLLVESRLAYIHQMMVQEIRKAGGRIDAIYYCPESNDNSPCRKPNTAMGLSAKQDFPEIDFIRSIMVGNNVSDMEFGKRLNMLTVFLPSTSPYLPFPHQAIDARFENLLSLAAACLD